jgi:AraC-like DNA-binding protein
MATCGQSPTPQALDHLRIVVGSLGAMAIPAQVVATEAAFKRLGERYEVADELLLERVRFVVVELVRVAERLSHEDSPRLQSADFPDQIMRAVEYIRENFSKGQLSLDRVAQEAAMSRYHFSRTFKRETGTRFIDFVAKVRLAQASTLLAETDRSITAIALAVGYQDLSPFERTFKRELGLTPSQYRRRVRVGLEVPAVGPSTAAGGAPSASAAS